MAKVGELSFDFVIDASSIGNSFNAIENRVGQLQSKLQSVGNSGVSVNTRDAEGSVSSLTDKVGILSNALKGMAVGAGFMVVQQGLQAVGSAWNFAKDAAIGYNDFQNGALKGFTSMLGSVQQATTFMRQLTEFANSTPFEIKGLTQASQQLLAFGFQANQIIPILTDIGNTSAYFHAGQQGIDAMTRALGQMNAATVLHTQDLYQMLNVGVPVWQILSDGMHKSVPEIQAMVSNGQIASSTFIELFDQWAHAPERANQMAQANKTLEGSMSTIHDVAQGLLATGFKPLYDMITSIANKAADLASGGTLESWGHNIANVVGGVVNVLKQIPAFFTDIADQWTYLMNGFRSNGIEGLAARIQAELYKVGGSFATAAADWIGKLADAFKGGGIIGVIELLLTTAIHTIESHLPDWAQAGATLVETFAQGMWSAVTGTVQGVINAIADFIGGFFIGHSPPPMGPLAGIEDAGRTLMGTYAAGMADGLDSIKSIPDEIQAMLGTIDSKGILDGLNSAIMQGAQNLDQMKAAAGFAGDALQAINGAEDQLGFQMDSLKMQIDDIKSSYDDQITQLQKQSDLLSQQVDYTRQMQDLRLQLQDLDIQQAIHDDSHLQALIKQQQAAQQSVKGMSGPQGTDPLTVQMQGLQHQLTSIPNDKAHADQRARITETINNLKYQQQQEGNLAKDQRANAQQNLDNITQQIDAIKQGYQSRQDDIKFQREGISLADQRGKLESQIAQLPYTQKIDELKKAESAALDPLQKQYDALNRQKTQLDEQKKIWEDIKKLADETVTALDKAAKAAAPKAGAAGGAGGLGKAGGGLDLSGKLNIPTQDITDAGSDAVYKVLEKSSQKVGESIKERAKEWGQKALDGFVAFIEQHWGHILGSAVGGVLGSALGPVGAIIGSLLGGKAGDALQESLKRVPWGDVLKTLQDGAVVVLDKLRAFFDVVKANWPEIQKFAIEVAGLAKNIGEVLFHAAQIILPILLAIGKFFIDHFGPITKIAGAIGAVVGVIALFNGIATAAAAAAGLIATGITAVGVAINIATAPVTLIIIAIGALVAGFILLYKNNQVFHDFVNQKLLPILKEIAAFIGGQLMNAWHAFVDLLQTRIIPAVKEAGTWFSEHILPVLKQVGEFILTRLIPTFIQMNVTIVQRVVEAVKTLASWFSDHILPVLEKFGTFIEQHVIGAFEKAVGWFNGTLFPALGRLHDWFDKTLMPLFNDFGTLLSITIFPAIQVAWQALWEYAQVFWEKIGKPTFDAVMAIITDLWGLVQKVWPDISHLIGIAMSEIGTIVRTGWDIVTAIIGPVMSEIGSIVRAAWETVKTVIDTTIKVIDDIIKIFIDLFRGNWSGLWRDVNKLASDAWDGIVSLIKIALNLVVDTVKNVWSVLSGVAEAIWNGVKSTIGNVFDAIGTVIHLALEAIKTAISDSFTFIRDNIIKPIWNDIKGVFDTMKEPMVNAAKVAFELAKAAIDTLMGAGEGIWSIVRIAWAGIQAVFDTTKDLMWNAIKLPFELARDGMDAIWTTGGSIMEKVKNAWDGIKKLFTDSKDEVSKAITAPFEAARDAFDGIFTTIKSKIQTPFNEIGSGIHSVLSGLRGGINWLAEKFDLPQMGEVPEIKWAAKGVVDFEGGPAVVGEKGWELGIIDGKAVRLGTRGPEFIPDLPKHATVVPHDLSERLVSKGVPGFAAGLNFDWLGDGLNVLKNGADWLWGQMLDHYVKIPNMDQKVFGDLSHALLNWVKDNVVKWIKGGLDKMLPVSPDSLQNMIRFADAQQGLPYIWGGGHGSGGAGIGFDCSGFVAAVLDAGGIPNPHGIVTAFYEWMQQGRSGVVDIGISDPYAAPDVQHTGIGLMGQWYESGGRAGGAGKTSDYFPIVGRPPGFPENARGTSDAAVLAWKNILENRVGQLGGTDFPPLSYLPAALSAVRAYANGGLITEPVDGLGRWSGARYSLGERGIETVTPGAKGQGGITITGDVQVMVTPPDNVNDPEAWGEKVGDGFVKHMRYVQGKAG